MLESNEPSLFSPTNRAGRNQIFSERKRQTPDLFSCQKKPILKVHPWLLSSSQIVDPIFVPKEVRPIGPMAPFLIFSMDATMLW